MVMNLNKRRSHGTLSKKRTKLLEMSRKEVFQMNRFQVLKEKLKRRYHSGINLLDMLL